MKRLGVAVTELLSSAFNPHSGQGGKLAKYVFGDSLLVCDGESCFDRVRTAPINTVYSASSSGMSLPPFTRLSSPTVFVSGYRSEFTMFWKQSSSERDATTLLAEILEQLKKVLAAKNQGGVQNRMPPLV